MKTKYRWLAALLWLLLVGCAPTAQPPSTASQSSTQQPADGPPTVLESDIEVLLDFIRQDADKLEYASYLYVQELSPDYSLCKYDNGTSMGALCLLDRAKELVTAIKNQPFEFYHSDFTNALFDETEKTVTLINRSGNRHFRPNDFPHCFEYSIAENTVTKTYLPLTLQTSAYCVGLHPYAFGKVSAAQVAGDRLQLTFAIDAAQQGLDVDNYFPAIELSYDALSGMVTLSLLHLQDEGRVLYTALQQLPGVTDVVVAQNGLTPAGTTVTFKLDAQYVLYGEVVSEEQYAATDHLALWTEKRG